jgi:phytoene dehydrogenase-like protein
VSRVHDAVVIGGGHNGLVCAALLARAGRRVLVLERGERVGGILADRELVPGARVPAVVHTVGRLRASLVRELDLERHGLRLLRSAIRAYAPRPEGGGIALWADPARTAEDLRAVSPRDAEAFPAFDRRVRAVASFLAHLAAATPPDVESPRPADALAGLRLGRAFRRLSPRARREVLRVLPMAVADLVGEAFRDEGLRGALAARGVLFTAMGPWSAGTAAVLLMDSAGNDGGAAGQTAFAAGGPSALARALEAAALEAGAEIRTGAEVVAVTTRDGRATGVALATGEEVAARVVVSGADPRSTLVDLVDPVVLGPTLLWRARNIRASGTAAKVHLVLGGLPRFPGADEERLAGRIVIAPGIDPLERAFDAWKYGRTSEEPLLEAVIPSIVDPSVAPAGKHVMSVIAQWAPYRLRERDWEGERERLGDLVVKALDAYAPGLADLVEAREVLAPPDLERAFGLPEGHVLHAEPGLDQFYAWRPLLGHARYRLGIPGLYLCGSGAHPGGGITGAPGANAAREILADLARDRRR